MDIEDLKHIEAYCPGETCGDPVPSFDGAVRYTKRRLTFTGFTGLKYAKYVCPVCGRQRQFRKVFAGDGYTEVENPR